MDLEQLFANFTSADLQWAVPVLAGVLIIVGGLLIGIIRGMTAGVIVALFFGGLMSMSPVLLQALERGAGAPVVSSADVARGAAEMSILNAEAVQDLSRVVYTMRTALEGIAPALTAAAGTEAGEANEQVTQRFTQGLSDTETQLDTITATVNRVTLLRERLEEDMRALELEERRAAAER